jgi:hypothetical protein
MNIQARKLTLIETLIHLNDESLINKIEKLVESKKSTELSPMSLDEFYSRIDKSEQAIKKGQVISQKDLEKESKNW